MESVWEELKADHERLFRRAGKVTGGEYNEQWSAWLTRSRQLLFASADLSWLLAELEAGRNSVLLSALIKGLETVPETLFFPMLRAAVYDPDPSLNSRYIFICLKHWGGVRVNDELFRYTTGTDLEKAGVANAFYHSLRPPSSFTGSTEGPTHEQVERVRLWCLEEFIANEDLQVRRNLIPWLHLSTPESYPESLRPLIPKSIAIARSHPDEYIRHRVEIQLGNPGPYMAKPSRGQE